MEWKEDFVENYDTFTKMFQLEKQEIDLEKLIKKYKLEEATYKFIVLSFKLSEEKNFSKNY